MAKQTGLFKFTGKLDNVIGYRRNGVHFVRSMPEKVQQTAATKRAARNFGIISRKGKLIRRALVPLLDMRCNGTLVNRLNKTLIQAGSNNLQFLEGFRFNRHTGMDKLFLVPPVFTDDGTLHISAQELLPQGNNTHVKIRLLAARIDFATQQVLHTDTVTEIIDLNEPFKGAELNVDISGKGTLLVMLQYIACTTCNGELCSTGDRRYMAANIIRVMAPAMPLQKAKGKKGNWKRPVYRKPVNRMAYRNGNMLPPVFKYQLE